MTRTYAQGNSAVGSIQINAPVNFYEATNREFLKSIKLWDDDSIRKISTERAPGTCEWIMNEPQYKAWEKNENQVLWVFGKPGSGKSFIACYLYEQLEAKGAAMQFFFDSKARTKERNLNSLKKFHQMCLYQLLMQVTGESKNQCFEIAREKLRDGDPTPESSLEAISGILEVLGAGYLVVDALDECLDETECALTRWLQELRAVRQLKIIITSRYLENMKNMATDTFQFQLSSATDKSNRDIRLYINHRLRGPESLPLPANPKTFIKTLKDQSDGMILYVRLILDMCKENPSKEDQLLKNLEKSPPGLSKLYTNLLKPLLAEREKTEFVRHIFQWLAVCRQPPCLDDLWSIDCIRQQIEHSNSCEWTGTQRRESYGFDKVQFCKLLKLYCLPLVEILKDDQGNETVRFVHTSVRQFLEGTQIEPGKYHESCPEPFRIRVINSHEFAAVICLTYLRWDSAATATAAVRPAYLENQRLLKYAAMEWEDHCERSQEKLTWRKAKEKGVLPFCKGQAFQNWLDLRAKWDKPFCFRFRLQDQTGRPSPLHVAIYFGLWRIARFLLQKKHVSTTDAAGNTPLHMAAARGSPEFVKKLVQAGAQCDAVDKNGLHPLHRAVRHDNVEVIEMLLRDSPEVVTAARKSSPTPLQIACQLGRKKCAFLLLNQEHDIPETAFKLAVENGHYKIVRRFLELDKTLAKNCSAPLLQAARKGKYDTVKLLVGKGVDLSYKDQHGQTVLHKACISGKENLVRFLLNQNIPSDPVDNSQQTPLCFAAEKGFLGIVKCLIEHRVNVNNLDKRKETPLFQAAQNGHVEVVKALLEHGTDATILNLWDQSPLRSAVMKGHAKIVEILLRRNEIDQNKPDSTGRTVLHNAAASLQPGQETIVDLLVNHGAQTDQLTVGTKQTALHTAILRKQDKPDRPGQLGRPLPTAALIQKLIGRGVPFDGLDSFGRSALFCATWASNLDVIKALLAAGASVDSDSFFMVVRRQNMDLMQLFLDARPRLNLAKRNWQGWTVLHMAVLQEHRDIVDKLLKEGAPKEALDHSKMTPLMYAEHTGNSEIIQLLQADTPGPGDMGRNELHWAAEKSENLEFDLLNSDQINQRDAVGRTPLHLAVLSGSVFTVSQLLTAKPDTELPDEIGQTPVHYASERDEFSAILVLLLRSKTNMEAVDEWGQRPLHLAVSHGCIDAVQTLLTAGTQLSGDMQGQTPLHLAVVGGHEEVVRAILEKWGQEAIDHGDAQQRTAIHFAAQEGRDNLVALLLEYISEDRRAVVVDRQDSTGKTALHLASAMGHLNTVRLLLDAGALVYRIDNDRYMAMHRAAEAGHSTVVKELLDVLPAHVERWLDGYPRLDTETLQEDGVDEAFHEALVQGLHDPSGAWTQDDRSVLTARVVSALQTWDSKRYSVPGTVLMRAVLGGHVDVVKLVLEKVPDMPLQTELLGHANPLTLAASRGHADIVRLLIQAGFNVHDTPDGQSTALHEAAKGGHVDVIQVLLHKGHADPDMARLFDGSVPLHLAAEGGHKEAVRVLVNVAFLNALDDANRTPMQRACLSHCETIVNQLLEAGADVLPGDIGLAYDAGFDKDTSEIMQEQAARQQR